MGVRGGGGGVGGLGGKGGDPKGQIGYRHADYEDPALGF